MCIRDRPWTAPESALRDPALIEAELRAWERKSNFPPRSVRPLAEPPVPSEAPAEREAQPLEEDHPMLAPSEVSQQYLVDNAMSSVEQCHQ
eukprot:732651-Alexandrium_andersonii.AAC.1